MFFFFCGGGGGVVFNILGGSDAINQIELIDLPLIGWESQGLLMEPCLDRSQVGAVGSSLP